MKLKEEDEIVNIIIKEYPNISKINIINDYKDFIEELNHIGISKETSKKGIIKNNDANISYCVIEITNKCCFKYDHCYIPNNNNYVGVRYLPYVFNIKENPAMID